MFYQKTVKYFLYFLFSVPYFFQAILAQKSVENEWARLTPSGTGSVYMEIRIMVIVMINYYQPLQIKLVWL